jgi:sugar O-acyltransferase (sialic acid O-acetyltransferase NeuD family)
VKVVVIGAGGHGREVLWLLRASGPEIEPVGFLDDDEGLQGRQVCELPVLGPITASTVGDPRVAYAWGIGFPRLRRQLAERLGSVSYFTARHPSVLLSEYVEIGEGSVICAGTILTSQVKVGRHVLINLHVTVSHDVVISDYCTLSPGVHLSGRVELGDGTCVGTGAVLLPGVKVGAWSVIGAGAVVTKDLPEGVVAVGIPARVVKSTEGSPEKEE